MLVVGLRCQGCLGSELALLQGMLPASALAKLFVDIGLGFVTRGLEWSLGLESEEVTIK